MQRREPRVPVEFVRDSTARRLSERGMFGDE